MSYLNSLFPQGNDKMSHPEWNKTLDALIDTAGRRDQVETILGSLLRNQPSLKTLETCCLMLADQGYKGPE